VNATSKGREVAMSGKEKAASYSKKCSTMKTKYQVILDAERL